MEILRGDGERFRFEPKRHKEALRTWPRELNRAIASGVMTFKDFLCWNTLAVELSDAVALKRLGSITFSDVSKETAVACRLASSRLDDPLWVAVKLSCEEEKTDKRSKGQEGTHKARVALISLLASCPRELLANALEGACERSAPKTFEAIFSSIRFEPTPVGGWPRVHLSGEGSKAEYGFSDNTRSLYRIYPFGRALPLAVRAGFVEGVRQIGQCVQKDPAWKPSRLAPNEFPDRIHAGRVFEKALENAPKSRSALIESLPFLGSVPDENAMDYYRMEARSVDASRGGDLAQRLVDEIKSMWEAHHEAQLLSASVSSKTDNKPAGSAAARI